MFHWMPSAASIAATCHFFIASTLVLLTFLCGVHSEWCMLPVVVWALPKEFIFDLIVEQDTVKDSITDFFWYMVGGLATCALLGLMVRYGLSVRWQL